VERRRPDSSSEDPEPRRRLHLPWIGIGGGAVAAVAVVIVAVVLFQRQSEWIRAPRPAVVGEPRSEPRAGARADSMLAKQGGSEEGQALGGKPAPSPRSNGVAAREKTAAKKAERDRLLAKSEAKAPPPSAGAVSGGGDVSLKDQASEVRAQVAPQALRVPQAEGNRKLMASQNAAPEAAPRGATVPGDAYSNVLRAYRLPPVWNPAVPGDAVARAETDLRYLYQTGRAGADSARIRLYLAEAERARLTDPSNIAAVESISHHYRRAISLAGGDATLAATARRRLAEFEQEMTRSRGTQP
jgi:hypothetical protein